MGASTPRDPDEASSGSKRRRLLQAFRSPNSYGLVLVLIAVTYGLSAALSSNWAASLVLVLQVATVWVTLRASKARRRTRSIMDVVLAVAVLVALANLFLHDQISGNGLMPTVGALLYLIAPLSILRHLVMRRTIDQETLLGAVAAYLLFGMFFAFVYRSTGANQAGAFFGAQGDGTFPQDLFFSFTTLTTTGYGNLVPAGNPGQSFAVLEMLLGQLFLITAIGKIISGMQPRQRPKE